MPKRPDVGDLIGLVKLARRVLDAVNASPAKVELPPDAQHALKHFYDLSDYHGVAPDSAPHIPDDGKI